MFASKCQPVHPLLFCLSNLPVYQLLFSAGLWAVALRFMPVLEQHYRLHARELYASEPTILVPVNNYLHFGNSLKTLMR